MDRCDVKYSSLYIVRHLKYMFLQDVWNKTWYPKAADHVNTSKTWYVVDATDKILGRLASTIAIHIRGKNLATYTPSVDMGSFVIVVCFTWRKYLTFFHILVIGGKQS